MKMVITIKEDTKTQEKMEMEFIVFMMGLYMKVVFEMTCFMDKEP